MSKAKEIEVIARAILATEDDQIALCRINNAKWYFLPGGHVDPGESATTALGRELYEEIGLSKFTVRNLAGIIENRYDLEGEPKHELNIVFNVIAHQPIIQSREDHIRIEVFSKDALDKLKILPKDMTRILTNRNKVSHNLI